jgi:hypothetical protein
MKNKLLAFLLLAVVSLSACAPAITTSEPTLVVAEEPLPLPTQPENTPQPELPITTAWKVVRDPRYGFGLAVPCWWLVNPIPEQGIGGVMTFTNYDENYFRANSTKGFWEWPNGTLKLDVIIVEGVDPAKPDAEAYMQFVDPTTTGLVSAEPQQIGAHNATVLTLSNLVNTNDPHTKFFTFRLAPDKLLMVVPYPQHIMDTPDFQAILTSIVLTPDDQVVLPTTIPAPALIDAPCAG